MVLSSFCVRINLFFLFCVCVLLYDLHNKIKINILLMTGLVALYRVTDILLQNSRQHSIYDSVSVSILRLTTVSVWVFFGRYNYTACVIR